MTPSDDYDERLAVGMHQADEELGGHEDDRRTFEDDRFSDTHDDFQLRHVEDDDLPDGYQLLVDPEDSPPKSIYDDI